MSKHRNTENQISLVVFLLATTAPLATNADHYQPLTDISVNTQETQKDNFNCLQDDDEDVVSEPQCETQGSDNAIFDTKPILTFSEQIDIRPETCESYFDDYLHTRRGLRIESALGTTSKFSNYTESVLTFPVVDFIIDSKAHVIKSKDLTAHIYTGQSTRTPLYDSIIADAEDIENRFFKVLDEERLIVSSVQGRTTMVRAGDISELDLHIVVQASIATDSQINQIKLAENEIKRRWGYRLKIIEIP